MSRDRGRFGLEQGPPRLGKILGLALALIAAAVAVVLGPPLYMALPPSVHKAVGQSLLLGTPTALYLCAWRRGLAKPWPLLDPADVPRRGLHRAVAIALQLATASFAAPLFLHPENGHKADWDLHLQWYEAIRQSILRFGQIPWWNAWSCGGFPLAAEPQVGLISIDTPLVLLLGGPAGLRVAAVLDMMLAVEGARRLARRWFADPWAVALAAAVYGWNGSILMFTVSGRALTMCYPFFPWMLLFALQIGRGARPAIALGVASAASVLTVIQYPTAYFMVLTAGVVAWGFLAESGRAARTRYLVNILVAAGVFLALAGARLGLTGAVMADFPRRLSTWVDDSILDVLHSTVVRQRLPEDNWAYHLGTPSESACYLGWVPMALAALSLRRGWRWWHAITLVSFVFATGSVRWYHPSYWLNQWPAFSAMHMVARWRLPGLLGVALAAADEVQSWRISGRRGPVAAAAALAAWTIADLFVYAHQLLPLCFVVPPSEVHSPGPPPPNFRVVNLETWEFHEFSQGYQATRDGYGVIRGYEPLLGYIRLTRPTARTWRGHPGYLGEFWSEGVAVEPVFWSPNRVELKVRPDGEVHINANPGSWWRVNGADPFAGMKCVETTRPFVARADASGRLVLEIVPRGLVAAAALTLAGVVVAAAGLAAGRAVEDRGGRGTSSDEAG